MAAPQKRMAECKSHTINSLPPSDLLTSRSTTLCVKKHRLIAILNSKQASHDELLPSHFHYPEIGLVKSRRGTLHPAFPVRNHSGDNCANHCEKTVISSASDEPNPRSRFLCNQDRLLCIAKHGYKKQWLLFPEERKGAKVLIGLRFFRRLPLLV